MLNFLNPISWEVFFISNMTLYKHHDFRLAYLI